MSDNKKIVYIKASKEDQEAFMEFLMNLPECKQLMKEWENKNELNKNRRR